MSLTSDYFIAIAEKLYMGNQLGFLDFDRRTEDLEVEEFEVNKGNYKTIITFKFNKQGYPVSHSYQATLVPNKEEEEINKLEQQLEKAKQDNDYKGVLAAEESLKRWYGKRVDKEGDYCGEA